MGVREALNKVFVFGDTHRKVTMGLIVFLIGFVCGLLIK